MSEEWITANEALEYLRRAAPSIHQRKTICIRAHAGIVQAKAETIVGVGERRTDELVPKKFWWAEGGLSLEQNWVAGDFSTWIDDRYEIKLFGVRFRAADIYAIVPGKSPAEVNDLRADEDISAESADANPVSADPNPSAQGRPKADWWDDLWVEMARQLFVGDLQPSKQADIESAMHDYLATIGKSAATSTVRGRARKLWHAISDKDDN